LTSKSYTIDTDHYLFQTNFVNALWRKKKGNRWTCHPPAAILILYERPIGAPQRECHRFDYVECVIFVIFRQNCELSAGIWAVKMIVRFLSVLCVGVLVASVQNVEGNNDNEGAWFFITIYFYLYFLAYFTRFMLQLHEKLLNMISFCGLF
jgi:hypothetical protein